MIYKEFGKTGKKVSQLGFGVMRLPMKGDDVNKELSIEMLQTAIEKGINYFDTGKIYLMNKVNKPSVKL